MHILFVTGEYPPRQGGVGAYTAEIAQALAATGVQVSVLTSAQAQPTGTQATIPIYPDIQQWDWRIWQQIPRLAKQVGATWVHIQYQTAAFAMHPAINLAPGYWRATRQPWQVAWTYHDLLVPYLFPKAGARLRRWITLRPAHTSDLVIATNEGDYRQVAKQAPSARLQKIPIGSNITVAPLALAERRQQRAAHGYRDQSLLLGYFGFLNRSKGGLTLVQTLHTLVQRGYDAHLLMIGERIGASDPTNAAYLQEVETLIQTLGLQDRVQWTGQLADQAVSHALQWIDVLLMPYSDGANLRRGTLMAGLAHGCAVVTTTPQSPLPELVDGRDLCYVPAAAPAAAADAIARLMDDPALRQHLQRGAQQQSQQFTWTAIAKQHWQNYTTGDVPGTGQR
ncbi:MAG: glycosyltransferase family 4 protein [Caldilineaceae bacterium]|nr:glycosyltransferase family 4 protein [Caldilineaceae bacterium]